MREANRAWLTSPLGVASLGQSYTAALRAAVPSAASLLYVVTEVIATTPESDRVVSGLTVACHDGDAEHWISVSLSTALRQGRRSWMVLHQDATAQRQEERRQEIILRTAAIQACPQDPAARERRVATAVGELLHASAVVVWEREASGALRARPLETGSLSPRVATIAHTRQLAAVMDGDAAEWLRLPDGTPCFAVPLSRRERVVLLHFPPRPRFDRDTLTLVARALRPTTTLLAHARAARGRTPRAARQAMDPDDARYPTLAQHERLHIERTVALCGNNMVRAAQVLGIARSTLYERLKDYGVTISVR